ncbi:HNH endonuclease [Halorarum salinum]|uniref:HNH endonuclease n=1 Tax=Halorarum salinum TaxID=2743089 RepID=A0A7D5LAW1_9EURY|nr:HNH endonuclease signature motif containing protein [Halobaculum salinum]QLG62208.1 HNH endonuclease [Halobaculum salinum]
MGVVRREGDWRLEKQGEGVYEITYQRKIQVRVLTADHNTGMMGGPTLDAVPVREVSSYSEAEGLFEEKAHGGPPIGMGSLGSSGASGNQTDLGGMIDFGGNDDGDFDATDLPPGGIAVALLVTGGIFLQTTGFAPNSPTFLFSAVLALGGVAIFAWAAVIYKTEGWSEAFEFLVAVDENSSQDSTNQKKRTPPAPEKLKNKLIFDRASQQCEWCEESFDHPHVHHIQPRREGGPNKPNNLIVLCPNCHEKADRESIPRSKLKAKVKRQPKISSS